MTARLRVGVSAAVAGLVASAALFGGAPGAGAAPAAGCPSVPTYFVTQTQLLPVSASGVIGTAVTLKRTYFDIAYSTDGTTLYATTNDAAKVVPVNPATGDEGTTITFTGDAVGKTVNAMTSLPSGKLLVGGSALYELDPATNLSAVSAYKLPTGAALGGDLVTLPGGDVLAALSDGKLARLHADGTSTVVGTVTGAYALAVSGTSVLIGTSSGALESLATVPTVAGTSALTTTPLPANAPSAVYGGASIQDAGECNVPTTTADSAQTPAGTPVTIKVLDNDTSGGAATTLDPKSVVLVNPAAPSKTSDGVTMNDVGAFASAADGTVTFTPASGYTGTTPAVTYRVANSLGQTATGTLTVTVAAAAETSSAASSSTAADPSSSAADSSGASGDAASSAQVTPTAVPAGFDEQDDTSGVALALGGVCVLLVTGAATSLLRSRRRQH